jgi:hypothetical protein
VSDKYLLVGQTPVPCVDLLTWAREFETMDRRVAETTVGDFWVSTVFLGLDHNWGHRGSPLLFETMVFPADKDTRGLDIHCERCSTWLEAEAQHARIVEEVRSGSIRNDS